MRCFVEVMKIEDAIDKFYTYNCINKEIYIAGYHEYNMDEFKLVDALIAEEILTNNIKAWLKVFDEKDSEVFLKLLSKYTYYTRRNYECLLSILFTKIEQVIISCEGRIGEVLFITGDSKSGVASGGDDLRTALKKVTKTKVNKNQIISSVSKFDIQILKNYKYFIFIDDIISTGFTLTSTVSKFLERSTSIIGEPANMFYASIAITTSAIKFIKRKNKKLNRRVEPIGTQNVLQSVFKRGIEFNQLSKKSTEEIIVKYEEKIDNSNKSKYSHVMGFEQSKQLISFYYNTPNNTLCSFWKESTINKPPFPRDVDKRLTLNEIKKNKRRNTNNAYNMVGDEYEGERTSDFDFYK